MKQLELGLYEYIYDDMQSSLANIEDYLNGENNNAINSWKEFGIDAGFNSLYGNPSLSIDLKKAIMNLVQNEAESRLLNLLRTLEGDFSQCKGYIPLIDPDNYAESHPDYQGGLIRVVDLEGKSITDNSMYENFIGFMEDQKDKASN